MLKHYNKNSNSLREKTYSRKISCFSIAGACCKLFGVCLLLLTSLLVNPATTSAYAFDSAPDDGGTGNTGNTGSNTGSSTITSTINIAFTPESGGASLTPISADGASAKYSIKATVGVENSGGYTVYLGSNKSELTGKNTGATINGVTSSATYEELPLNTWGYNAEEGETPGTTFSKVPTNNRGDVIASNNSANIKTDEKTFTLSFAAHIGNDKPADTYENEITLSVVSSPLEVVGLKGIAAMQEMTSEICAASELGDTKQLVDLRDNKSYWVKKMPDNGCWMVQNLDLDLGSSWPDARLSDYTVASTTYKPVATANSVTSTTIDSSSTSTRSWSLGDYVITKPIDNSGCGNAKNSFANCAAQFTSVSSKTAATDASFYSDNGKVVIVGNKYDAHYLVGNHYQWNTATAGTGGVITSGQASGSICPKGWTLPASAGQTSYATLFAADNIGTSVAKIVEFPYFFVRAGYVNRSIGYLLANAGSDGNYWTTTPSGNSSAFNLNFNSIVAVSTNYYRYGGLSVRCIAR